MHERFRSGDSGSERYESSYKNALLKYYIVTTEVLTEYLDFHVLYLCSEKKCTLKKITVKIA
jgi:hypothetical protein